MTSKARSKSTNKKPGATPADKRILAQAAQEDAEGSPAPSSDTLLVRRIELESVADTLDEQIDNLISISDGFLQEADEAVVALSILMNLKLQRDMVRNALRGTGFMVLGTVQP
jgi:hypothetical protein